MSTHDPQRPPSAKLRAMREAVLDATADAYPNDTTSAHVNLLIEAAAYLDRQAMLSTVVDDLPRSGESAWMAQA